MILKSNNVYSGVQSRSMKVEAYPYAYQQGIYFQVNA